MDGGLNVRTEPMSPRVPLKIKNNSFLTEQEEDAQVHTQRDGGGVGWGVAVIVWLSGVAPGCPQEGEGGLGQRWTMAKQEQRGLEV